MFCRFEPIIRIGKMHGVKEYGGTGSGDAGVLPAFFYLVGFIIDTRWQDC